jgi:hypothetical protein
VEAGQTAGQPASFTGIAKYAATTDVPVYFSHDISALISRLFSNNLLGSPGPSSGVALLFLESEGTK